MIGFRLFDLTKDWNWFAELNPIKRVEDTTGLVAFNEQTNEPYGAVVMDTFTGNSVQCHITIKRPICLKYGLIEKATDFIFNVCNLGLIIGLVPSDNQKAIKLNKKIGFKESTRIYNAHDVGVDTIIMVMTKDSCRYLGG